MQRRVTLDDIRKINEVYYICQSYAETARETGWSAATVRNYVDHNFSPILEDNIKRFNPDTDMPEFDESKFEGIDNYGDLCILSEDEYKEIQDLWKEIPV